MKTIIGWISVVLVTATTLWNCTFFREMFAPPPQPIMSIADLMIDKITHPLDTAKSTLSKVVKLRMYDSLFYKALFVSDTLPNLYFYSRKGSCCPCTSGGKSCCTCSSGTAFGVPAQAISNAVGMRKLDGAPAFMLAKMSDVPPTDTLKLTSHIIDGMKIFTVPVNTRAGKYQVSFKGHSIDLTLVITIDENHNIEIAEVP